MRKLIVLIVFAGFLTSAAWAGGIMTNTNQSASFIRMPARDASLGIDAVYYNPAGLTGLGDGFHLSLNNQSIFQTRKINSSFAMLNDGDYRGDVSAPLFPSVYAVYKTGSLAISGGFMPVGGGGGAEYSRGLPSFETDLAAVPMLVSGAGIPTTFYDADIFFEGSSVFYGGQLGVSYQVSEMIGVYGGIRYVAASNSYKGHLQNLMINPVHPLNAGGGMVNATEFFTSLSAIAFFTAGELQPIITGGGGSLTLDQAVALTILTPTEAGQIAGGLGASYDESLTISQIQSAYQAASETASGYAGMLDDRRVDARQTGSAIAPLLGVNLSLSEQFNIGIKYEFLTRLELENDTETDETGMFPDGAKTRSDMPAKLSVGAAYQATSKLNIAAAMNYFFDKSADYGNALPNKDIIDNNFIELALGLEYGLTDNLLVSAGYLRTQTGANKNFHSDLSHSLSSNSIGFGGRFSINEMMAVNLGFLRTFYEEDSIRQNFGPLGTANEIYNRSAMVFAIGVDFRF
jgi:long-chain fatty acid transport protein